MKRNRLFSFVLVLGMILLSVYCNAQEMNCSDRYEAALGLYNYGMADSALRTLKPCLDNKQVLKQQSKEISASMFRLAALSSIMTGNPEEADKYINRLLQYQPGYKENFREDDLEEFRLILLNKSTHPSIMLGIRGGLNIPFLKLQKNYTYPEKNADTYELKKSTGFQIALTGEKTFTSNFSVEMGAGLTGIQFDYKVKSSNYEPYYYEQKITCIEIPVLARYYFAPNSSFKSYVQGGISGRFSLYKREKSDDFGNYWFTESSNSDNILTTFRTDMENIGFVMGGGVAYNLKKISIRADIRYTHHLNSSSRLSKFEDINGYEDIPSSEKFGYTNDINLITVNDLQISLGLVYYLNYKVF